MAVSPNIKRKPLSLGESYDIVRTGIGTYLATDSGDKQLWAWGYNGHGELANGDRIPRSSAVQIPGTNWKEVSVGSHHNLAVKEDGTLWAWGYNNHSQLSNCGVNHLSSPTQIPGTNWCYVGANSTQGGLALKTDGTLWTWGHNNWGQLGLTDACCGWSDGVGCCKCIYRCPTQVAGNNWKFASNSCHSTIGLKCDGTLWSWGHNGHGQLGYCCTVRQIPGTCCAPACINPSTGCYYPCCSTSLDLCPNFSSPTQITGNNWVSISSGCNTKYGIKSDGTLWSWGYDYHGSTGTSFASFADRYCPVQIPGTWVEVGARGYGASARRSDNTLWTWGHGHCGQNAQLNDSDQLSPVQVLGTWIKISQQGPDAYSTKAIKCDGTLWGWGCNRHGEIGDDSFTNLTSMQYYVSSPTLICGTGWICGSTGRHSTAWIKCIS